MIQSREVIMKLMAENYYYFLNTLNFKDEIYMAGMAEARTKFLANLHITLMKQQLPTKCKNWRFSSDFVSERALEHLKKRKWNGHTLQYDHMIPKTKYIRKACESATKNGEITIDYIFNILMRYLWTATIHIDENQLLNGCGYKNKMPEDWDGVNIFARYEKAKIKLIEHDKSYLYID